MVLAGCYTLQDSCRLNGTVLACRYDRHDSGMLIASLCNIDAIPVGMVIAYCIDLLLQYM